MQWLKTSKYTIINWYYWNFKIYENIYVDVTYDFLKFDGFDKINCGIPNGITKGLVCFIIFYSLSTYLCYLLIM
jgi:hypothetical protein